MRGKVGRNVRCHFIERPNSQAAGCGVCGKGSDVKSFFVFRPLRVRVIVRVRVRVS